MQTIDSAKRFLLNRVVEQASTEGIALSEIEKRMFLFSETSSNPDWEANEKFEAEYDDSEYEKKIARLLRRAYANDKKHPSTESTWEECLSAMRKEDFYGLVMVDQAGIKRPKNYISATPGPGFIVFMVIEAAIVGLAFGVLTNRIRGQFLSSDILRFATIAFLIAAAWGLGKLYEMWIAKKIAERISHSGRN